MPVILLFIGAIIAVAAFNNAQGTLAAELEADIPPFLKWALAVFAIGGLGFVPGMAKISRYLLALVFLVIVVKNYQAIIAGFQAFQGSGAQAPTQTQASATPASAYAANPANPQITTAEVTGTGSLPASLGASSENINATAQQPIVTSPFGAFDPGMFLASFEAGFGGFGGVV